MKKFKTFLLITVIVLGITSCKKDRTCTCNITYNIPGTPQYTEQTSSTIIDAKKKDAKKSCTEVEQRITSAFGGQATGSCSID